MSELLYVITGLCLIVSIYRDRGKTKMALKKAWKSFANILPQFIGIVLFVGILLAFFDEEVISRYIGEGSGFLGIILSAVVGAVTLIPGFVAFPTASILLENGAGYMQTGAFISSLMMVGLVTFSVEKSYFNAKFAIVRNVSAFVFSIIVAFFIGAVFMYL